MLREGLMLREGVLMLREGELMLREGAVLISREGAVLISREGAVERLLGVKVREGRSPDTCPPLLRLPPLNPPWLLPLLRLGAVARVELSRLPPCPNVPLLLRLRSMAPRLPLPRLS